MNQTIISVWARVADGWVLIGVYADAMHAMHAKREAIAEGFTDVFTRISQLEPPTKAGAQ